MSGVSARSYLQKNAACVELIIQSKMWFIIETNKSFQMIVLNTAS